MNARASFAVATAGLAVALLAGCGSNGSSNGSSSGSSSGGGSATSTTPPAVATTTVTASAPPAASPADGIAGSATPSTAASPATTRPSSSSTNTSAADGSYAAFIGTWNGHGRTLTVAADGGVSMDFRTYRTCSSTVTTGCDRMSGNSIIDGGQVKGMITHVDNASTVIVTVYSSTDQRDVPIVNFTLGHDIAHHALAARVGPFAENAPFCGSGAPNGYCGA